jgi:hypothetical protein
VTFLFDTVGVRDDVLERLPSQLWFGIDDVVHVSIIIASCHRFLVWILDGGKSADFDLFE